MTLGAATFTANEAPEAAAVRSCYHCGLPIAADVDIRSRIDGREVALCCHGCEAALAFVLGAGLDDFYRLRRAATGVRALDPEARDDDALQDLQVYADAEVAARYVVHDDAGDRATLALDGVRCAACAWVIEQALGRLEGVLDVRVQLASSRLDLCFDGARLSLADVLERVTTLGFGAVPARSDAETALHERQRRRSLQALGISGLCAMQVMMLAVADYATQISGGDMDVGYRALLVWAQAVLATVVMAFGARGFFSGASAALRHGHLTLDVPVALALLIAYGSSLLALLSGAAARGAHVYFDSVTMFTFLLLLGRHMELGVRHRFARIDHGIESLLPAVAHRLDADGARRAVVTADLQVGDRIELHPGDIMPADTVIESGSGQLEQAMLTGETRPLQIQPGAHAVAGSRVLDATLVGRVVRPAAASDVAGIPALLERARRQRPRRLGLADRIAGRFLAGVLGITAITAMAWWLVDPERVVEVVVATLIVSCPCALSLAAPAAITAATLRLRQWGVLIVDADALERSADIDLVVFDKTGTLTLPGSEAVDFEPVDPAAPARDALPRREQWPALCAALEQNVPHPLGRLLRAHAQPQMDARVTDRRMVSGAGVEGQLDGLQWRLGRAAWIDPAWPDGTWLACRSDDSAWQPVARLQVAEALREGAATLLQTLHARGLQTALLSGDDPQRVAACAHALDVESWHARAQPADKLGILQAMHEAGQRPLYIGDGLNDAPALAGAAVSVAVSAASDYSRTAADVVLLRDDLQGLTRLLDTARAARARLRENLMWALAYNLAALPLAVTGLLTPWLAALGMSASSLLVLANALRLLRTGAP